MKRRTLVVYIPLLLVAAVLSIILPFMLWEEPRQSLALFSPLLQGWLRFLQQISPNLLKLAIAVSLPLVILLVVRLILYFASPTETQNSIPGNGFEAIFPLPTEPAKRRKGGPRGTSEERKLELIKGWWAVEGKEPQEVYCKRKGIGVSTLTGWIRELEAEGKLLHS